ncbi:MAG: hypothetical protein R3212_08165 [Xanthomonadales bacterium]|nr:hypothetical protein [Xanthomonadales bacterium]
MYKKLLIVLLASSWLVPALAQQPQPTPQERVAQLKAWLQASHQQMLHYEWIETTTLLKGGEAKSSKQNQCYYGADGKIQKVPVGDGGEGKAGGPPGLLPAGRMAKRHAKHEKEELEKYLKSAATLVQSYVPPSPELIQNAINSGNFAVNAVKPGQQVRIDFHNYQKTGDLLSIDIELPTNRLMGMQVSTFMEENADPVNLDVGMGVLPDGTIYTASTKLVAPAKDIVVDIENTGHRKVGG